jgi:hypothetical protein
MEMSTLPQVLQEDGLGRTLRRDAWWLQPILVAVGLGVFGIYSTWAALQGAHYEWGPYLSPFYSPLLLLDWWEWSPAILILWAPLGFRATCYYYRKAYYRAYFLDPPACSVGEARNSYRGETAFPFVLQNLHRYFLILAVVLVVFLWSDVIHAFNFDGSFGIGVGTLVLLANSLFLSLYTLGCHSLRHFAGGNIDCHSCVMFGRARLRAWQGVSVLNRHHMLWAWVSLFMVGFGDLYVRLVSMGVWHDVRFL